MKKSIIALIFFLLFGSAPAPAAQLVDVAAQPLTLEIHQGRLLRLPAPADQIFIADPAIADVQVKSPTMIYVYGKETGETALYAVDRRGGLLVNQQITVTHDLTRLGQALHEVLPQGGVKVASVAGAVVLSGKVASAGEAENVRRLAAETAGGDKNVINNLQVVAPNQINLRVRIAEVSRNVVKQLGFNWDLVRTGSSFMFGLATGSSAAAIAGSLGGGANTIAGALPGSLAGGTAQNNYGAGFSHYASGHFDLNAIVDALDQEGLITTLAEPNLTALTGETASFLAGGEFPIVVPAGQGTFAVQFKQFGVSLAFTPTILGDGRVNMKVRPEVSQLSTSGAVQLNGFTIPALTTRRAETTVELASGQSFAIAGLLSNDVNHGISQLPGLGDLPVLGQLFRSDSFQRNESELVIIVTPYLVRPVATADMALPTDGFDPPHDLDRILFGANYRRHDPGTARTSLQGPVGFVLE